VAARHALYEYIPNDTSDTLLISYGIVSRVINELQKKYGFFRPIRLFPFLEKELRAAAKSYKKIIVVEASDGQLASEVERVLARPVKRIPLLGGEIKLSAVKEQL
jgi:2-oxoglutarate/2-oxoacid ferredoxin oxidoreductase subunit alpha